MSREFELLKPISGTTAVSRGLECRGLAAPSRHHVTPGSRAFFEVCEMLDDPSWFRAWQNEDYCNMQAKEKRFLALEDRESVICKVKFAAAHRLAGVALKQMHLDAFRPSEECGPASPLMDAVLTEVHRLRPSTDVKQRWARPQRRLMVVRANGKTTCLSHSH
ncbi:uncharacterized protein LOC144167438 [Haemaphysalis longicornis]